MAEFPLCPDCLAEYTNPHDRRYHAQPLSCPHCGPTLWTELPGHPHPHHHTTEDVITAAHHIWDNGGICAVKGIGGFHLMCDAHNDHAIATLRQRKRRPDKPLALMVPDLATAHQLVTLNSADEKLLTSPSRPIVIAPSRGNLPPSLAPGMTTLGIMLPYSPLHTLLVDRPVVATSGNRSGQPLCYTTTAARDILTDVADLFIMHNRGIHLPVDDSVIQGTTPLRRSRGYAPAPLTLPTPPIPSPCSPLVANSKTPSP